VLVNPVHAADGPLRAVSQSPFADNGYAAARANSKFSGLRAPATKAFETGYGNSAVTRFSFLSTVCLTSLMKEPESEYWTHFVEVEQPVLQSLAAEAFPFFTSSERTVHAGMSR
jgi:hypothetical protein